MPHTSDVRTLFLSPQLPPTCAHTSLQDVVLHIIGVIGTAGGTGSVIEFCGDAIAGLSMEARMSMCNMAIEVSKEVAREGGGVPLSG